MLYPNQLQIASSSFDLSAIGHHLAMIHRLADRSGVSGKVILAGFGEGIAPVVHHSNVGNVGDALAAVLANRDAPINWHAPLVVMRQDLPPGAKGREADIVAVLGLVVDGDADKGRAAPVPPVEANYVLETSAGNRQHFILLDRALAPSEAKAFGVALKRATGADCADDISHVWRVDGTHNYPTASKLKRGRSPEPQPVRVVKPWNGSVTNVDELYRVLAPHWHEPQESQSAVVGASDPADLAALVSFLAEQGEFVDYQEWLTIGMACKLAAGDAGLDAWRKAHDGTVTPQVEAVKWASFASEPKPGRVTVTIGTFIKRARELGYTKGVGKSLSAMFNNGVVEEMASPSIVPAAAGGGLTGPRGEILPGDCDEALALGFAGQYANTLRYCEELGRWLLWTGTHWRTDKTSAAYYCVRTYLREFASRQAFQDGRKTAAARTVAAVAHMTRSDPRIATVAEMWDADPWLLNTPGGVVDLRTGKMRPASPSDHMTKITAVAPGGSCPTFLSFLAQVTGGDAELMAFIQRMLGYGLTGLTIEHALFFLYGTGGNGKGVLLSTVRGILRDYHRIAPLATFTASHNKQHPTDLAGLRGARLVTANETEEGDRWDEAKIKALTGGDEISARLMRQDFFDFVPQFKLVIAGNHRPALRNVDEAMRRRMNLLPFGVTIPPEQRDPQLVEKLKAEWAGILAWMIEGCLAWQQGGLQPPASVQAATDDYLSAEDTVERWIADRCQRDPQAWTSSNVLFASWAAWTAATGEWTGTQKRFSQALKDRKFRPEHKSTGNGFVGLRISSTAAHMPGAGGPLMPPGRP
jgi:putative DNA primase/helicase